MKNNMLQDPSLCGMVSSSIASNHYYDFILNDVSSGKPSRFVGSRSVSCKVCGTTRTTLLKDGEGYICKDCKMLEALNEDDEGDENDVI